MRVSMSKMGAVFLSAGPLNTLTLLPSTPSRSLYTLSPIVRERRGGGEPRREGERKEEVEEGERGGGGGEKDDGRRREEKRREEKQTRREEEEEEREGGAARDSAKAEPDEKDRDRIEVAKRRPTELKGFFKQGRGDRKAHV